MTKSIVAFGDSIMKGIVYDKSKDKYVYSDKSFLKRFSRKRGLSVDNRASFGCTLLKGQRIIERSLKNLSKDKLIALEFGGNDCDYLWEEISKDPYGDHLPKTPIDLFKEVYSNIIDTFLKRKNQILLFTLPPLDAKRYFSWISKRLNRDNILSWIGEIDAIYNWHKDYNGVIEDLAEEKNLSLIDVRRAFLDSRNYKDLLCQDGIHPNEEGHSLIYDLVSLAL